MSAARRITPKTSHSGMSSSVHSAGQPSRPPPSNPASNRIASGQSNTDLPLRRTMGGNRIGQRIHAGKECPPRRAQRFVGFKHHRELDQIVAAHPHQCPGARLRRDLASHGRRHRRARATRPKYNRGADRVSVPYPRDARSRRTIPSLLHSLRCMLSRASRRRERPLVACRCPPERLPQNRGKKQSGLRCFKNECGGVSPPDLQLREDHAARCGSDRSWLHGQGHASQPALRPRPRPLQGRRSSKARRSRSPAPRKRRCFGKSRRIRRKPNSPSSTSARPAAGRRTPRQQVRKLRR